MTNKILSLHLRAETQYFEIVYGGFILGVDLHVSEKEKPKFFIEGFTDAEFKKTAAVRKPFMKLEDISREEFINLCSCFSVLNQTDEKVEEEPNFASLYAAFKESKAPNTAVSTVVTPSGKTNPPMPASGATAGAQQAT